MTHFHSRSEIRIFYFAEVTHMHTFRQVSTRTQVNKWAHTDTVFNYGILHHCHLNMAVIADLCVANKCIGAYFTTIRDAGFSLKVSVWK